MWASIKLQFGSESLIMLLCISLLMNAYLWVPLDLVALQKLAVVFICCCSNRQLVFVAVVVVRSVNLFSFGCL